MRRAGKGDPDYAYGATMLTLRTAISLSQEELAHCLGVSRRAVAEWEAGNCYPKAEHLKALIELGVKSQAFAEASAAEEIRALWRAARQKVLLDEHWLSALLSQHSSASQSLASAQENPPIRQSLRIMLAVDLTIVIDTASGVAMVEAARIEQEG